MTIWMPLQPLRTFAEAARLKSFKKAAAVLNVTPTAVSHQIRKLEEDLGVALFERHVRSISLTRAGAELYPVLREAFDQVHEALEQVRSTARAKPVVMSATMAVSTLWVAPRIAGFKQAFPDVGFRVLASDDRVDLAAGEADFAVRFATEPDGALETMDLAEGCFAPVVGAVFGAVEPAQLAGMPLLTFDWRVPAADQPDWRQWWAQAGLGAFPAARVTTFSDEAHAIQAALGGQGALLANLSLLSAELAAGTLRRIPGPRLTYGRFRLVRMPTRRAGHADQAWQWWQRELSGGIASA